MNITVPTGYNPYNMTFPSIVLGNTEDPTNSPQHPENFTLDMVETGVTSLLVGRITAKSATLAMQLSQTNNKPASALGLGMKTAFRTSLKSGLVASAVSVARNGYHMAKGEVNLARAGGNVTADLLGGTVGGMMAAGSAGIAVKMLSGSGAFSMSTVGLIAGAAAFALADTAYNATGLREEVSNKVTGIIERWFDDDDQGGGV